MLGIARHELDDVCLVIDMECFRVSGVYRCREFGYCSWRGDSGRVAVTPAKPLSRLTPGEKQQAHFLTREVHGLFYTVFQEGGRRLFRHVLHEKTLRRICHAGQTARGFQGRTRRKRSFELSRHALFGFGNAGMSQVRSIASSWTTRTDLRVACHSQQASLRHGRMRRLF